ncbi:MAG: AraC family transcriptional regulator [Pseudomonadota bacterium]
MDEPTMVNFPLPMVTALLFGVVAVLVWRMELGQTRASAMFSALFAMGAVASFLVGLRFGYGVTALVPLQRVLPLFLGPVMYLGFAAMTVDARGFARIALAHLSAPPVVLGLLWLLIGDLRFLDWLIAGSYLGYAIALFLLWRKGPDALSYARVDVTRSLSNWTLRGLGLLLFVLLLDTAIALDFAFNQGSNVSTLISAGAVPLILLLLAIMLTMPHMLQRPKPAPPAPEGEDAKVEARLRALMEEEALFLDPDLTVQRLAKRLHVPARTVSTAINRTQGMNVSQYVNEFRLAHAARLLVEDRASVTKISAQSGFLTRSNFYREFQRVYGQSPTEYRNASDPSD